MSAKVETGPAAAQGDPPPPAEAAAAAEAPGTVPLLDPTVTVIEPRRGWQVINWAELWRCRGLFYTLVWRDVRARYKQTVLGVAWVLFRPLTTVAIFALVFGRLARFGDQTGEIPYALYVFAGLMPWMFFSSALTASSGSVLADQSLVTKIHFPRLIIPLAAVGSSLIDMVLIFGILLLLMPVFGVLPGWQLVLAPVPLVGLAAAAGGFGALLSAASVRYRDVFHAIGFLVQIWMYATPVIYLPAEQLSGEWVQRLMPLNPAYGLIENFRLAVLGGPLNWYSLGVSGAVAALVLVVGCLYFRRAEPGFADNI